MTTVLSKLIASTCFEQKSNLFAQSPENYSVSMQKRSLTTMTDRQSFLRDREVIADLCLKKRSQGDRDRKI